MTFEEVISTIENKRRFGKAYGRDVTIELMSALGNPEKDFEVIHIAGTNGKGSVAAFVSSILQAASFSCKEPFKVGTFVSPHLVDFTERIIVDGRQIPREDAVRIGELLLATKTKLEPTMFDYCLAMAMIYFKEQGVKYLVLETGLGGSKDSTAGLALIPKVSIITSIGLEHTQILGNSLEEIAAEKAGVFKAGTKAVLGRVDDSARRVIIEKANSLGVPVFEPEPVSEDIELGLFGSFQRGNASLAACATRLLGISDELILQGLKSAKWPGRMDIVSNEPFIMLDGAHNPSGVKALHDSLQAAFPGEKFSFIMAVMADKDYISMAGMMQDLAERFYTCTIDYGRALQSQDLADALAMQGFEATSFKDYSQAIAMAKESDEKIVIFGSLYFIGEVLKDYR